MPQTKNHRFPLAEFMKKKKEIRQSIVNQNRRLACEQKKIKRLEEKFEKVKQRRENVLQELQNVQGNIPEDSRTVKPTSLENNESTMSRSTASARREKTFSTALKIHGGSVSKPKPAYDGLVDTMNKKFTIKHFKEYFGNHRVVKEHVLPKVYEEQLREFEKSAARYTRSISVFYSGGVLGKRKYQAIRVAESMQSNPVGRKTALCVMKGCKLPKLLTYNSLRNEINKIDIGRVYSLDEGELAFIDDSTDSVSGCYRDLRQFLPRLAKFYLKLNDTRKDKLKWFSENENTFLVALGGDGCPFGKHESACSFLVSFINVGHRVASSDENYLVFGGNCDEGYIVIKKYVQMLVKQMSDLDGKTVSYDGIDMVFKFEEFPNDMMLCTLAGEISNAASYFSTFADVCKGNASDLTGTFGKRPSDTLKPFTYKESCEVSQKVSKFKEQLSNSGLAESTARSKVTTYIGTLKSRQEFEPLIGEFVDKFHIEPLHMKNNAWQQWQKGLLNLAISKSNIPPACSSFKDVNPESPFARYVNTIQYEVKAKCLARKIKKWFNETEGNGKELEYRLTGKDSRLLCHNFMLLVKCVSVDGESSKERFSVLVYAFIGLKLRNCVSIFSRLEIDPEQIRALEENSQAYFRANAMFVPKAVTPTVWSMGHIIPAHTKFFYEKYSQGLLTNTMEGREAKHIVLMRLSQNTTYQNRWREIFRHEFVKLIWLREQEGYSSGESSNARNVYIPPNAHKESHCYCGLQKAATEDPVCCFCGDDLMKELELCTKQGKITKKMKTILSSK